jgi:hypothetical protein
MGRRFDVRYKDRSLGIYVHPVDEAWEFWLCERGRRLALGAQMLIDDVVLAWRRGEKDPFLATFEGICRRLANGELVLPEVTEHAAP